jgi:predicted nucleotidyltransferase
MLAMTAVDLASIKDGVAMCVSKKREIQAAYVFGSVASGRVRPGSDVDIAVLLNPKSARLGSLRYRLQLAAEIANAIGRSDVDLVILNDASPVLAHQVLSKGKLAFERSARARIEFQVRTVNTYLDTEPMRALYRQYLKKRIREGKIFG